MSFPRFVDHPMPTGGVAAPIEVTCRRRQIWANVIFDTVTAARNGLRCSVDLRVTAGYTGEGLEAAAQSAVDNLIALEIEKHERARRYREVVVPRRIAHRIDPIFSAWYEDDSGQILAASEPALALDVLETAFSDRDHFIKWLRRRRVSKTDWPLRKKKAYIYRPLPDLLPEHRTRLFERIAQAELRLAGSTGIYSFIGDSGGRPMTWSTNLGYVSVSDDLHLISHAADYDDDSLPGRRIVAAVRARDPRPYLKTFLKALFTSNTAEFCVPIERKTGWFESLDEDLLPSKLLKRWNVS